MQSSTETTHRSSPVDRGVDAVASGPTRDMTGSRPPRVRADISGIMWRRLLARLIDGFIVWWVSLGVLFSVVATTWPRATLVLSPSPWGEVFVFTLITFGLGMVYEVGFLSTTGQTPGRLLTGIRVVDIHTLGSPGRAQALVRWSLPGLAGIIPLWLGIIGTLAGLGATGYAGPERRDVMDLLAETRVVRSSTRFSEGYVPDPHETFSHEVLRSALNRVI